MVQITGTLGKVLKVLLFKAQAHLAYDPYLAGLQAMTNAILADTGAAYLYSIGTAGGAGAADLLVMYRWPLLVTTDESMYTTVIGIKRMIAGGDSATEWNLVMATAILAIFS